MISYLTSVNTFSLSRTSFEILDFKVLGQPWPLIFRGHSRTKIFSTFESPYMISYPTSVDIFSLSRTVFEIFEFKVIKVWRLTFTGHLKLKIFLLFGSSYMTSFYRHRFRDIRLHSFWGLTLTFNLYIYRSPEVENIFTKRKLTHDFLSNFCWHFLFILYRFRDIPLQSFKVLSLTSDFYRSSEIRNILAIRKPFLF